MEYPDRLALLIRRRQPYIDWANSLDDGGPTYDLKTNRPTTYLIDEMADTSDLKKVLRRYWRDIFEEELNSWMRDPDAWPQRRTYSVFLKWFEVELCDMVVDLGRWPIQYD